MTPDAARRLSSRELAHAFAAGHRFDPHSVAGWVYRGTSLGLPRWIDRLTWIKFAKAFDHRARGWNIRIEQTGPWRPQLRRGRPITFGHFAVVERDAGILLDYSAGRGALRLLRDPVVALDDRADTLLGRSLVQLGPAAIPTPSYFLLERGDPLN